MEEYQRRTGRAVYVLCLTAGEETNLYWDSLGGGADCRIEFIGPALKPAPNTCGPPNSFLTRLPKAALRIALSDKSSFLERLV
jgi:hypothetical protein